MKCVNCVVLNWIHSGVVFPLFCLSLGGIIITNGSKIKIPIIFLSVRTERCRMVELINAKDPSNERICELYDYEVDPLERKKLRPRKTRRAK